MQNIGQYILHVGLAALLVGIICEFSDGKSSTGMLTRMICGLFLAFTVINPLTELNFDILESFSGITTHNGQQAVSAGTAMAEESMREIIRQESAAYILDKARSLGCDLYADVTVGEGDNPLPESVCITGNVSTQIRRLLEALLETELGIPKENQQWIG